MIVGGCIILIYAFILFLGSKAEKTIPYSNPSAITSNHPSIESTDIVYTGATNGIGLGEIEAILEKRYHYYTCLHPELKERFLQRTQSFMRKKIFIIKNDEGYREMPVLV